MNLLLFKGEDIINNRVILTDEVRITHILNVLKQQKGGRVKCGIINGLMGEGILLDSSPEKIEIELNLIQRPPVPFPTTLIVAMSRPKTMRKVIRFAVTLGVKDIHIINAAKVDKGFWQSPLFEKNMLEKEVVLALEQAKDTMMPTIVFHTQFRPFAEDILPSIVAPVSENGRLLFHPYHAINFKQDEAIKCYVIAIGPEGGWVDFEVDLFEKVGFKRCYLCERILRVEQATAYALGRLF